MARVLMERDLGSRTDESRVWWQIRCVGENTMLGQVDTVEAAELCSA